MILHSDCDAFYASVECMDYPALRGKPVAVCGDPALRHGIVLAKSQEAKRCGIKTGNPIWMARQLCPGLVVVPARMERYVQISSIVRRMYDDYTDRVEPFGLDECWLDVGGPAVDFDQGERLADEIRARVLREIGITVSVGVADNKIFAKLGSDMKKPNGTTVIRPDNVRETVHPLPVSDLLYVGAATGRRLRDLGVCTIGQLAAMPEELVRFALGKNGVMLRRFALGLDDSAVAYTGETAPIKSVGNSITTVRDLVDDQDVWLTLFMLAEAVAMRLRRQGLRCRTVQLWVRDNALAGFERQCKLAMPSAWSRALAEAAMELFRRHYGWARPVRSVGVRGCDLVPASQPLQMDLWGQGQRQHHFEQLEAEIDKLRGRYGYGCVQRGLLLTDRGIGDARPDDHIRPGGEIQGR